MKNKPIYLVLALVFILAACGPAATSGPLLSDDSAAGDNLLASSTPETATVESVPPLPFSTTTVQVPDWFKETLSDAATGMDFTIAGFQGKVILVETLAMWCSTCRTQQGQVSDLRNMLGMRDDFVTVGLDIDLNERFSDLQTYVAQHGFDWYYAVATPSVASQIGSLYGNLYLNPPSAPILIVDRHGEVHTLPFGIKSAADLLAFIQPYLDEGM